MKAAARSNRESHFEFNTLFWKDVVNEVMKRKVNGQKTSLLSDNRDDKTSCIKTRQK
jgi:hypothetical protein